MLLTIKVMTCSSDPLSDPTTISYVAQILLADSFDIICPPARLGGSQLAAEALLVQLWPRAAPRGTESCRSLGCVGLSKCHQVGGLAGKPGTRALWWHVLHMSRRHGAP